MVIKAQNNELIIKQLTELLNNAFEQSLDEMTNRYDVVRTIKKSINENNVIGEATILAGFVYYWINNTCYDTLSEYTNLMRNNDRKLLNSVFSEKSYRINKGSSPFFEQTLIPLAIRIKEYNGSAEEALLSIVKPVLVEEFVSALTINELETTLELLSIVNHYNDYDYQLQRFISVFEENLLKQGENKNPLELLVVWWLDKTFLKNTIIPELTKRTLIKEQKQKAGIDKNSYELVNNYYDYCLYYAFAKTDHAIRIKLFDTAFFYEKEDFDKAVIIIKNAVVNFQYFGEDDVELTHEWLLIRTAQTKPEWVESLRVLLSS